MTEQQLREAGGEIVSFLRRHALAIIPALVGLGVFLSEFRALQIEVASTRAAVTELRGAIVFEQRDVVHLADLERSEARLNRELDRLRDDIQFQRRSLITLAERQARPRTDADRTGP